MNEAIYQKVNELWLIFSQQEMLCARFVEPFSIGGYRLPPRRQKQRGKDYAVERFTWSESQNCWMQTSWESVVPSRVVTVESMVRSVYQHWLEHKNLSLMEHEIIRRFAIGKIGARNDDTRLILKWIKQAEQGGIGTIDTKMLGPVGVNESTVRSNTGVDPAEPQENKNTAPIAKMTVGSATAEAKVESPKATRSRKAVDLQVTYSPKKIAIRQATPTPMGNISTQAIQQRRTDIRTPAIQIPKTSTTPEVMYLTTRTIESSVFLPRKTITSPVAQTTRNIVSTQSTAVQRRFPPSPPTLDTTSQSSKSFPATPNRTPSTSTPQKSPSIVKLPFDANPRGRSRSPCAPRDPSSTPRSYYRQRDDDARSPSIASSSQILISTVPYHHGDRKHTHKKQADTYRPSYSDYSSKPRSRDDLTRVRSAPEREAATKPIRNINTSPTSLSYPKPREETPQSSRNIHDTPARPTSTSYSQIQTQAPAQPYPESAAYPPPQYRTPTKIHSAPTRYPSNAPTGSRNPHVSPINAPTGPRNPYASGFRPGHPLPMRPPQSEFPSAKQSHSFHPGRRSLMISEEGNANDEKLGKRQTINDRRMSEKSGESRAREVTEDNLDLKDQKSSPVPLPKRDYVYTEGRDDLEQYKDTGDYY
jgi:hypothetical protein